MNQNIVGAVITAAIGLLIAFINYMLSKSVLIKSPERYSLITVARQLLQIGFLVVVYFVGEKTSLADPTYLLVGAVVGMTVPMLLFTKKLIDINSTAVKNKTEKEDEADG